MTQDKQQFTTVLNKMSTQVNTPSVEQTDDDSQFVQYFLPLTNCEENSLVHMNHLLHKEVTLVLEGFECLHCKLPKDIYRQGHCKKCFFDQPSTGDWVIRPELSTAHLGIEDRDLAYEQKVQLTPHIVYLSNTGTIKVGVTRKTQVPTRWIDQGAHEALELVEVPNRYLAGITEVALKEFVADKTNWRKMLKNDVEPIDLQQLKLTLLDHVPSEVVPYVLHDNSETQINFPVHKYPEKVKSLNLKKQEAYTGMLVGIKGQYLIFEDNTVFNVRSNEGLKVSFICADKA